MDVTKFKLTNVCDFQGGSQPPKKEWIKTPKEGYVRMLQIRDFTQRDKDNIEYVKDSKKLKKCKSDDVLIGRYGASVGKILTGLEGAYNVAIMKAIPNEKVLNKQYLLTLLRGPVFQNFIQNIGGRAAQAGFNKEDLSKYYLSLPSLDNQKRIAKVLSDCEALITKRKESIAHLDELLKSTFLEMFGGIFDDNLEPLSNYLKVQQGYAFKSKDFVENGVPVIKIGTVNKGNFDLTSFSFLPNSYLDTHNRFKITAGDLMISMTGTVGKEDYGNTCFATNEYESYLLNQRVGKLIPIKNKINLYFLHYLFQIPRVKSTLIKANRGVRQANISSTDITGIKISIPLIAQQNEFAHIVEQVENIKQLYQIHLQELENLYGSLSQKAFKGELDVSKVGLLETRMFSSDPDETPEDFKAWAEEQLKEEVEDIKTPVSDSLEPSVIEDSKQDNKGEDFLHFDGENDYLPISEEQIDINKDGNSEFLKSESNEERISNDFISAPKIEDEELRKIYREKLVEFVKNQEGNFSKFLDDFYYRYKNRSIEIDYELLKQELFEILGEKNPEIKQWFNQQSEQLEFKFNEIKKS
ncbi:MAG: hypothetical protein GYB35_09920 [Algicola sp.]|nr:hypothetical protein [Algicola sp.]